VRDAQVLSREAQARAARAARRNNFQGTPETVVKAAKSVLEVKRGGAGVWRRHEPRRRGRGEI